MKMNNCNHGTVVYGFFPEIPGNMGRVDIDSEWIEETVNQYKQLGKSLEVCKEEMSVVVNDDQFIWTAPEMKERFLADITACFNK